MFNNGFGRKRWAFAAGHIPLHSTGKEPTFTSHDKIAVLNTSDTTAVVKMTIYFEEGSPVSEYTLHIKGSRVRKIRFNDLIDPTPIQLDRPFAFVLTSDVNVIVQFSRADTSSRQHAGFCVTPFSTHYE